MLDISVPAHVVAHIGPVPISNAVIAAFVASALLVLIAVFVRAGMALVPTRGQVLFEFIFDYIDTQLTQSFGSKERGRKFFPLIMTILLFIAVANQLSVFPLLFQIIVNDTPLLRLPTSDLSQTLTMGLFVVILANILALLLAPARHIGGFIRIKPLLQIRKPGDIGNALIQLFLGIMDIIGEFAKVISISARLFGNLFAGDVMVAVIVSLSTYTQFIVPIPFLFLGIFSGFVQAFVFTLLSIQFLSGPVMNGVKNREERLALSAKAS